MAVNQFTPPDANQSHVQLKAPGDGSPLQITDANLLFKGDYSRSGNDLEISGSDGKSITIEGYFHTGSASALVGPNGAMLSGDVVEALAGPLYPGQYAQSGDAGQSGNPIGEVQHLEGSATATRTDGSVVQLQPGTKVYLGDVVETGSNTKFGLSLEDGSLFSMTSDARMVLNEFVFNGAEAQDSSMLVNLVQGAFVFVAGSIAPTGNMKVETPVAVLAIRGTTVGADVDTQLGSTTLSLFQDIDSNTTGEYLVLDKATGEIIGQVTEVGNKLIITGVGETPIIVQKTDQDQLNDLSALELIRAIYAKASGQQGEFDSESGSGSFFDIQLVSLSGSMTIEELAGNPLAMASAQKIVFDTPDQDDPPVAFFDGFATDEDDIFAGNVISNSSIQPDEDPEGFDVRVVGFGEDLIWEEGVDFDFEGGIISATGSTTFVLSSGAVVEISANGNFTYNPNPAFDFLADGESAVDSFSYLIADPGNSTDSDTVEVTVFGSNDQPVVISAQASHEDGITETAATQSSPSELVASGIVAFEDLDSTDGHNTSITNTPVFDGAQWNRAGAPAENLGDVFGEIFGDVQLTLTETPSATPDPGASPNPGQVAWEFTIADQDVDFLGAGETLVVTYIVNVQDDSGTSNDTTSQLITVTITGTNDVPLIDVTAGARDITGAVDEIADLSTDPAELSDNLVETGVITFTDVDLSDQHTASVTDSSVTASTLANGYVLTAAQTSALFSAFSLDDGSSRTSFDSVFGSPTAGDGTVDWTFLIADQDVDFLGADDIVELSFDVTINDGNGGTVTETVVITVTGTNDVPVITSVAQSGTVTETADVPGGTDTDPDNATGTISFTDVDLSDDPAASHDGGSVSDSTLANGYTLTTGTGSQTEALLNAFSLDDPALGNFSQADGTGSTGWTYDVANADIDFLGAGDSVELTYVVTIDDGNGGTTTQDVVITINGTNDEPVITSAAQSGTVTETADVPGGTDTDPASATGTISFTDVDLSDDPTASHDGGSVSDSTLANGYTLTTGPGSQAEALLNAFSLDDPALGNFSQTDGTGSTGWTYDVANADIDFLGAEDSVELTYVVTIDDGNGGTATQNVVVTINGTNDAPVVAAIAQSDLSEQTDTSALTATIAVSFLDVDLTDVGHSAAVTEAEATGVTDGLALDEAGLIALMTPGAVTKTAGADTGSVTLGFSAASTTFDYLSDGEEVTLAYTVEIDDGDGGVTPQAFVVTITGTNDAPVIASAENASGIVEAGSGVAGISELSGDVSSTWTDADLGEQALLKVVGGSAGIAPQLVLTFTGGSGDEAEIAGIYGSLFIKEDGSYRYVLDDADADTEALTDGQSVTDSFNYTIANGEDAGDTTTSTINIDIAGSDDGPSLNIVNYEDFEFSYENLVPDEVYQTEEFGQDLFSFQDGALEDSPPYVLTDFVPTEDVLDLSNLLENTEYTPGSSAIEDYVQLVDDGTDTTVQFDPDGPESGADYVDLAVLDDVTGAGGINIIDAPLPPVSS
ncbi:MAG: VCBS domain-containing protein [Anderseniella sp.]